MEAAAAASARGVGVGSSSTVDRGPKVELISALEAEEASEEERNAGARSDQVCAGVCGGGGGEILAMMSKKRGRGEKAVAGCVTTAKERISRMPPCAAGKRSSIYRGVTRHRWTGRYEAHLWDKSTWNQNQNKKGKQVYLGAYDDEEAAARAYDLAALKYWGAGTLINFPVSDYSRDLEEMQLVSKEDYLVSLRRKSSAFSKGFPKCRSISRQPQNSQWETPLSQMLGTSRDAEIKRKYAGGFCLDRKIDLTRYIKWWIPNKAHQLDSGDKSYEETVAFSDDVDKELQTLESAVQSTEPYQLPSLGITNKINSCASPVSACNILSQSATFKNLQQKFLETQDGGCDRNTDDCRAMEMASHCDQTDRSGATFGLCDMPLQRVPYPGGPLPQELSRTGCNLIDSVADPLLWAA
uniref:AP2-like ethylene-responsive transcription factor At2g41710 n=1 Tax=Anthurium amnicola TaxID=1678845 RepID=A0A1D1ZFF9_9ARAE